MKDGSPIWRNPEETIVQAISKLQNSGAQINLLTLVSIETECSDYDSDDELDNSDVEFPDAYHQYAGLAAT